MTRELQQIDVDRIFLYEENPRHEPLANEDEVIRYLCRDEQVFNLARSISEAGTNPLALLGVVQLPGSGRAATKKTYQAWEGNRRVCAIKLLNDPDRAPPDLRKDFARLAATSGHVPIRRITSVVFDDHEELKFWMGIIHDGAQSGVGLLDWDAEQKARHFGSSRNKVALAVLDAAEAMGLITKEERNGKLTTVQRFLNRSVVKEALGIDASNPDDVTYNRPVPDLKKQLGRFINDLKRNKITSRYDADQADTYGRQLARHKDLTGERIQPLALKAATASAALIKPKRRTTPKKPRLKDHLEYDKALAQALENIGNDKLESLYFSVCYVGLGAHTPLLTIGVWAFVETLSALAGRHADTEFVAFFSANKLADMGFGNKKKSGPIHDALTRIQRNGNATKHHEISATFDGKQLANDLATITPLLMKTIEGLPPK
ncbi:MAG: hypothetical protein ABL866_05965 [Devosia sp.]